MKKKKDIFVIIASILVCLIVIGIVIIALIMGGNETHTTEDYVGEKSEILHCTSSSPKDGFFAISQDANIVEHELKFMFNKMGIYNAAYSYNATYSSEKIAKKALSKMHWNYDDYMGKTSIYQENLTPVFNNYNNDARISLFFDKKYLVSEVSDLLFLKKEEFEKAMKYSIDELSEFYKNKNFSCKIDKFSN